MKKIIILILCVFALAGLLWAAGSVTQQEEAVTVENAGTAQNAVVKQTFLTREGKQYPMKSHLQTVLLIGTDGDEAYQPEENKLLDYFNFDQADVLMLLVVDKDNNTVDVIQVNRDTMSAVPWLDVLGNYGGTEIKQICLAFNYGDGGAKSCKNTVDAVSRLLFDAPIQSYIQIPVTAVSLLNDLVGGVPVTMPEDLTVIDPSFTEGATVRLNGSQAEQFLRVRMALENDTNAARMERHRIYMNSFQSCAKAALNSDSAFAMKLIEALSEYMQSDLTAQQLSDLVERLDNAVIHPIRTSDGKLTLNEKYYEFYADEDSLWEIVKNAYCQ